MRSMALAFVAIVMLNVTMAQAIDPVFATRLAIDGYDPVAYFTESKPVRGSPEFEFEWKGAKWFFASAENRSRFVQSPLSFAPQYGGYCAYAVSRGRVAGIRPEAWSIADGKLYLNFNLKIRSRWEADRDSMIRQADENWPGILGGKTDPAPSPDSSSGKQS